MATLNDNRQSVNVTTNKTLVAADAGIVQNVTVTGLTITLPATVNGLNYIVRNGGLAPTGAPAGAVSDGGVTVTVAPNASDGFTGNGFTAAVNKAAINTLGNIGDEIAFDGNGTTGATGWTFRSVKGTWTRAA